jgi:hypothetical protein
MKEGIFILQESITNPEPDRRMRDSWLHKPIWEKGGTYVIRRATWIERDWKESGVEIGAAYELRNVDSRHAPSVAFVVRDHLIFGAGRVESIGHRGDKMGKALLTLAEALEPSKEKYDELRWCFYERGENVDRARLEGKRSRDRRGVRAS